MKTAGHIVIFFLLIIIMPAKAQIDTKAHVNNVLMAYLGVKDALVADNSPLANQKAKVFIAALKEVSDNELDAHQKEIWLAYFEKLRFDGEHIGESTAIDHQREHFASLSKNMYAVIKAFRDNKTVLYQQYCPMKKEYWLSETPAIKNPYYGKKMLECGVTKETLKAN